MTLKLPSEVRDRNFLFIPVERMVIESDEEYSKCGKWILTNRTGSLVWIDEVWKKLQILLEDGTLIRIKASTAAMEDSLGTVMCFTKPGINEIKRAAEEIRKAVNYESCMYYKINSMTELGINGRNGHKRIAKYMHSFRGFLYKSDQTAGWILESDLEYQRLRPPVSLNKTEKLKQGGIFSAKFIGEILKHQQQLVEKAIECDSSPQTGSSPVDISMQFENYMTESQLRFDLNPFEWWKSRENKNPGIADLTKKYLCIPSSSASSERDFSATDVLQLYSLPSKTRKMRLELESESIKGTNNNLHINTTCSMKAEEHGLTVADRLWIVGGKLMDEGYIKRMTCHKKFSMAAEFNFYFCKFPVYDSHFPYEPIVELCDTFYHKAHYYGFMYFVTPEYKKYRYSPEGELYECEKFVFLKK